ncbi:MAG: uracil glycosylase superfamily protein [Mycobacterium sp.]|nr:uracil glycosylase superfamily protein [Mycobacterium sp.]
MNRLAAAARGCRDCQLYADAKQTVFGAGPRAARMMLVGEQPGDQEDRAGKPFVGPAGRILDQALDAAGIDRDDLYVTNAVKHFKFTVRTERGKRRIHQTPSRTEAVACRPWLLAELDAVEPAVVVLMGAVAAKSLLGNDFRLTAHRGELLHLAADDGLRNPDLVVTVHPSSILRGPPERRDEALRGLVDDLRFAAATRDVARDRRDA